MTSKSVHYTIEIFYLKYASILIVAYVYLAYLEPNVLITIV